MAKLKDEYFAHPAKSRSQLAEFEIAPAYYKYFKDHPDERPPVSTGTLKGSALHYLVFEKENFGKYMRVLKLEDKPVPGKDFRNPENQAWKKDIEAKAEADGVELISSDDMNKAEDMYDSLQREAQVKELLFSKQVTYEEMSTWGWNGIQFKRKVDFGYKGMYIGDLKSAEDAHPLVFPRKVFDWGYDLQGGMYSDGGRILADSEFFDPYYLIAIESKPPYMASVHLLSDEVLEYGASRYRALALELDACEKADHWPGYEKFYKGANNIYLPKYLKKDE